MQLKHYLLSIVVSILFYSNSFCQVNNNTSIDSVNIIHYEFNIEINDNNDVIKGTAYVHFIPKQDIRSLNLDFVSIGESGKGMKVLGISSSKKQLSFEHRAEKLKIYTRDDWKQNDTISIKINYKGVPKDGLIISNNKFGSRTFFGDNWPNRAHHYLPTIDHPSDKATVDFIITAPNHYEIIANGKMIERSYIDPTKKLTHWSSKTTIPTKVMVFGAADFSTSFVGTVGCIPVTTWVYHQNKIEGFSDYQPAIEALQFFVDNIGEFPYHKIANVQSKTRYGGMENASCIFYFENSVNGKANVDDLIAHEMAHQWFGNSVSEKEWNHIWVSEGFATYLADLFMKDKYGNEEFHKRLQNEKKIALDFIRNKPMSIIVKDISNLNSLLNPNAYQRAAWVLHMFHNKVGDQLFWTSLQDYYYSFKDQNATTEDFVNSVGKSTNQNWEQFFQQWLNRPDYPILDISTAIIENNQLEITIRQTQEGAVYQLDLYPKLLQGDNKTTYNIQTNKKETKFIINNVSKEYQLDWSALDDVFCEWKVN